MTVLRQDEASGQMQAIGDVMRVTLGRDFRRGQWPLGHSDGSRRTDEARDMIVGNRPSLRSELGARKIGIDCLPHAYQR